MLLGSHLPCCPLSMWGELAPPTAPKMRSRSATPAARAGPGRAGRPPGRRPSRPDWPPRRPGPGFSWSLRPALVPGGTGHPGQDGVEHLGLVAVEVAGEVLLDAAEVDRGRAPEGGPPLRGEHGEGPAAVGRGALAADQAVALHA